MSELLTIGVSSADIHEIMKCVENWVKHRESASNCAYNRQLKIYNTAIENNLPAKCPSAPKINLKNERMKHLVEEYKKIGMQPEPPRPPKLKMSTLPSINKGSQIKEINDTHSAQQQILRTTEMNDKNLLACVNSLSNLDVSRTQKFSDLNEL